MLCPNCFYETRPEKYCESCGFNIALYNKIYRISAQLYNKGLDCAKASDLSGAIEALNKSVEFYKFNTDARNLLGLAYYEMGMIGDALMHWIISSSFQKNDNIASEYIERIQQNGRELEIYNDAIRMYNQARLYVIQKSDDIAIIQLKKAIDNSPNLIPALNLLALCHMIHKDRQSALALVQRVLSIDVNNAIALNYFKELQPNGNRPQPIQIKTYNPKPRSTFMSNPIDQKKGFANTFHLAEIISFIVGVGAALAIMYILIIPALSKQSADELTAMKDEFAQKEATYKNESDQNTAKIKNLEDRIQELTTINDTLSLNAREESIKSAEALQARGNTIEAAKLLYETKTDNLKSDTIELANRLKAAIHPKLYTEGIAAYNANSYELAKEHLEKALDFAEIDGTNVDNILYYLGLVAKATDNKIEAIDYFDRIITEFPDSSQLDNAKNQTSIIQNSQ